MLGSRAILPLTLLLAGCPSANPVACTAEAIASVTVELHDAVTGSPIAQGARGMLREGAYTDSMVALGPATLMPAQTWERAGTYTVTVEKPGYQGATRENVVVARGRCHVDGQLLRIDLQPLPVGGAVSSAGG
jgi:hypothetical protein